LINSNPTSAIARMNLFLHGAADFQIVRGDTLRNPAYFLGDNLATFDCVIANPPFSLEKWGEEVWASDPYGRNFAGMPPAKSGDYAWVQHMIKSMAPKTGRMAVVRPHGALFRMSAEGKIRTKVLGMDVLEAIIGLGPFASDPRGRNLYGTPPQGRADYAFWQHILLSMTPKAGRCAILFPHGVLFRQEEADMRRRLVEADLIECVLGLGPNLFYNSPMEACVVICRSVKPKQRRNKILFINAINEGTRERAQSFLTDGHIERIVAAYRNFADQPGLARVASLEEIRAKDGNLSIPLYVSTQVSEAREESADYAVNGLPGAISAWLKSSVQVREALGHLLASKSGRNGKA
jgi:type I restriction-modification system DNA methylase subunit